MGARGSCSSIDRWDFNAGPASRSAWLLSIVNRRFENVRSGKELAAGRENGYKMPKMLGKTALVTGAASGLGAATARLLLREGANVVATDIREDILDELVQEKADGTLLTLSHDVTSEKDWERVVAEALRAFGRIDALVNNAGISSSATLGETDLALWNRVQAVNSTGPFLGMKTVIPGMVRNGGGSVVNISSVSGLVGDSDIAYGASKGAVRSMTKSVAMEVASSGVRVNSVHPGGMRTPMIDSTDNAAFAEIEAQIATISPLPPHIGEPEDVASTVVFLASDESRLMTGSELVVDMGWTAH